MTKGWIFGPPVLPRILEQMLESVDQPFARMWMSWKHRTGKRAPWLRKYIDRTDQPGKFIYPFFCFSNFESNHQTTRGFARYFPLQRRLFNLFLFVCLFVSRYWDVLFVYYESGAWMNCDHMYPSASTQGDCHTSSAASTPHLRTVKLVIRSKDHLQAMASNPIAMASRGNERWDESPRKDSTQRVRQVVQQINMSISQALKGQPV